MRSLCRIPILYRYVFFNLQVPFLLAVFFFLFVFLMRQILEITHWIINFRISAGSFFALLFYMMPNFLVYVIPMAVMMAVLVVILSMSADNEITALKASGISLFRLVPPVLTFSVIAALVGLSMSLWGMPAGMNAYKQKLFRIVRENVNIGLSERTFNDFFEGVVFYVNRIDYKDRSLNDVFIEDDRQPGVAVTVVAPKGYISESPDGDSYILTLYKGTINRVDLAKRQAYTVNFDTYEIRLDLKAAGISKRLSRRSKKEMSIEELMAREKELKSSGEPLGPVLMEIHQRFAIPISAVVLSVLAIPLGIRRIRSRRSAGLAIALGSFIIYYFLLTTGSLLVSKGLLPPFVGAWLADMVLGVFGVYALVRSARDRGLIPAWMYNACLIVFAKGKALVFFHSKARGTGA